MSGTAREVRLTADCHIRHFGADRVYFKFNPECLADVYPDASPFAAALLVPAMALGEDLEIEGAVSEKLLAGMKNIVSLMSGWGLGLRPIRIRAHKAVPDRGRPKHVATFFSGGVDSFYTYLKRKGQIDTFMVVNGYDIDLGNDQLWRTSCRSVREVARDAGVRLIEIESNIRHLIDPIVPWINAYGGCLAAAGLCLRREIKQIYISSGLKKEAQIPEGSHHLLDHFWSTEIIAFAQDGHEASRFEKVRRIADSPLALRHLRVCYMNRKGSYNCGRCEKCLRTMTALYALGKLSQAKTLPGTIDKDQLFRVISASDVIGVAMHHDNLDALKDANIDPGLQAAIEEAIAAVKTKTTEKRDKLQDKLYYWDHMYLRGLARHAKALILRRY